ncbi:regulator of chromosome condensation 1/beta-lactamase-inhibitor protein II [Aspergillus cavernicola]|uniref:Regulator of chromosome condensation 1/beta-lactamase-inhibitor protein II n=1 Tax=Aspergillus cavernicola TaxID=176166 RepID=A0ABR4J336_9EURO
MQHPHPTLFAFGSNGSGQLGLGHDEDVSSPTKCLFEEEAENADTPSSRERESDNRSDSGGGCGVSRIVAGGNHTLILLNDGRVYAAGWNGDGRCGARPDFEGSVSNSLDRFRRLVVQDAGTGRVEDRFKGVSATWEGTALVASDGDGVFILGSGAKGELGLGPETVRSTTATRIPNFPPQGTNVVSIVSGMGHTVVVLSNGAVYGWGAARKGQLGNAMVSEKIVWSPVRIEGVPFAVSEAACGREFTVLCGDKDAGEFVVFGASGNKWNILSGVPGSEDVKGYLKIDASWHGVYVHRNDFSVLAWGRDDRGQLLSGDFGRAREVAVGSEHVVALREDRTVVAFGWGEHGNCGPDTDAQGNAKGTGSGIPLPEGIEVVGAGAGCATSWIIAS